METAFIKSAYSIKSQKKLDNTFTQWMLQIVHVLSTAQHCKTT